MKWVSYFHRQKMLMGRQTLYNNHLMYKRYVKQNAFFSVTCNKGPTYENRLLGNNLRIEMRLSFWWEIIAKYKGETLQSETNWPLSGIPENFYTTVQDSKSNTDKGAEKQFFPSNSTITSKK